MAVGDGVDFGEVPVAETSGPEVLTIANEGAQDLEVESASLAGPDAASFAIVAPDAFALSAEVTESRPAQSVGRGWRRWIQRQQPNAAAGGSAAAAAPARRFGEEETTPNLPQGAGRRQAAAGKAAKRIRFVRVPKGPRTRAH